MSRSSSSSSSKKKKQLINSFSDLIAFGHTRTSPTSPSSSHDPSLEDHTLDTKILKEINDLNQYGFTFYSTNDGDKTYSIEFAIPKLLVSKLVKKLKTTDYWYAIYPHNISEWEHNESIGKNVIAHYDKNKIHRTYLVHEENNDPHVFETGRYAVRSEQFPNGWYRDSPTTIAFNKRIHFMEEPEIMLQWTVFDELHQIATPEVYTELVGVIVEDPKIGRKSLYRELTKILHDINNPPKRSSSRSVVESLKNFILK